MDIVDKQLLNLIQKNFPIHEKPFETLANQLEVSEAEVINRIDNLKEKGIIRRIGGIFDSNKLGYFSTLCAMKVPQDRIEEVDRLINNYQEVTHNYLREHKYNIWFTLIGETLEKVEEILKEIKKQIGEIELINLPAVNLFKIDVYLNISGE